MPDLKLLFLQMIVILVAARLMTVASRFVGQPPVAGEMLAGILLGPSLLGRISATAMNGLFPPTGLGPLYALSQLGLVLFMFLVGLEVWPREARPSARAVVLTSQASIVAPFLFGGTLAWIVYPQVQTGASRCLFVLFVGSAVSVTAFPVLARILADRKLTNTRVGTIAISCAAVDDVTAWILFAIITVLARPESHNTALTWHFTILAFYILAMLFIVRPVLRRLFPADRPLGPGYFGIAMIFLLVSVYATEALSVHALFGAFLAGAVMPKEGCLEAEFRRHLEFVTLAILLPLFFAYTGMRTSFGLLNNAWAWLLCGLILLVAVASKFLVSAACVRASGMPWRESLSVGALVNTRGLVELVILNAGLDLHILSPSLFSMMVIMAVATTLMTAPLLDLILPPSCRVAMTAKVLGQRTWSPVAPSRDRVASSQVLRMG